MNVDTWMVAGVLAAQGACGWLAWRAARGAERVERTVARHQEALALLTETSESGFAAVAAEITRAAAARPAPAPRKPSTRRIAAAARRGTAIQEIAAAEQLSEGEVRLRLQMAGEPAKREGRRAAVRA